MSHSWSGWLGQVLEAPDPVQAYFSENETWKLDCVDDDTTAVEIPCAYDCTNITAILAVQTVINTLWQCIFYPNVTNDFRLGILSQAQESVLENAHLDTSLTKAATVTSTISTCLSAFCEGLEGCKQLRPVVCSAAALSINGSMFDKNATDACIEAICANHPEPLTNTDIAGIGVILSYIIQFALTLLGALALVILQYLYKADNRYVSVPHSGHVHGAAISQAGGRGQDSEVQIEYQPEAEASIPLEPSVQRPAEFKQVPETDQEDQETSMVPKVYSAIVAALIEFLKAQCFTAIAICIAALIVLNSQAQISTIDAVALGEAGGVSIIPITFNYYVLATFNTDPKDYQRKSWFLYGLCLCSWVLGLSVVLSSQMFKANEGGLLPDIISPGTFNSQYPNACGNASPLNICPRANQGYDVNSQFIFFYTLCVPTMVGLTVWQLSTLAPVSQFLSTIFHKSSQAKIPLFALLHLFALSLFIAPVVFFFDSLSELFRDGNISFDWTFGQILAITLWIPSIVGFLDYLFEGFTTAHEGQMPVRYSIKTNY